MLHSITWQSFTLVLLAVIAVYYILSVVFLYRRDGITLLKARFSQRDEAVRDTSVDDNNVPLSGATMWDVMGAVSYKIAEPQIPESVAADELVFVEDDNQIPETFLPLIEKVTSADSLLIGSVADLLQELKTLFKMLQGYNSSKEEGCSLLQSLLTKYPHLAESNFRDSITEYVCDLSRKTLTYELGFQEVDSFWQRPTT